jgi:hypothetical protein
MTAKSLPFANVAKQSLSDLIDGLDPVVEAILSLLVQAQVAQNWPKGDRALFPGSDACFRWKLFAHCPSNWHSTIKNRKQAGCPEADEQAFRRLS